MKLKFKSGLQIERKAIASLLVSAFGLLAFLPFQNCAQESLEFTQLENKVSYAYAYGNADSDRDLLQKKMSGYERPSLNDIFNQWSRISGSRTFQKASQIVPESAYSYCFTSLDQNGYWIHGTDPVTGTSFNPATRSECLQLETFAAASWSYLEASKSLRCAANVANFVGFVSGVPFDSFESEAVVTSDDKDDDVIALIIASVTDSQNNVHVLAALRSQGGARPLRGWGFGYYLNGALQSSYYDVSVGGVSVRNSGGNGWNGSHSLVKVIRQKDQITAFASTWGTSDQVFELDPNSKIEINLADPVFNGALDIFKGPQKYGYGSRSQRGATFKNINFKSLEATADYLYDLKHNKVFKKIDDGSDRYENIRTSAFKQLGSNMYVINPETQRAFYLWSEGRYKEVEGDSLNEIPAQ